MRARIYKIISLHLFALILRVLVAIYGLFWYKVALHSGKRLNPV